MSILLYMDAMLKKFDRRAAHKGRNKVAFYMDALLYTFFCMALSFTLMLELGAGRQLSFILAIIVSAIYLCIARLVHVRRSKQRIASERRRLAAQTLSQKLMLMSEVEYKNAVRGFAAHLGLLDGTLVFPVQSCRDLERDDIFRAYRLAKEGGYGSACVFCASEAGTDAKLGKLGDISIEIYSPQRLVSELENLAVSEDELEQAIACEAEKAKKRRANFLKTAFSKDKSRAYMLSGLILTVLSLFTRYAVYFRILGTVSIVAALAIRFFKNSRHD